MARLVQGQLGAAGILNHVTRPKPWSAIGFGNSTPLAFSSSTVFWMSSHMRYSSWKPGSIAVDGMHAQLSRRQRENQPTVAGVDRGEAQHISKEGPNRVRILVEDQRMDASNHRFWHTL